MSDQYPIIRNMYKQLNTVAKPVLADLQLDFIDQIASLFSVGSFYYFIFNFASFKFEYVHPNIKNVLGIEPKELTFDKYFEIIHPDFLKVYEKKEKAVGEFLLNTIKPTDIPKYKVVYLNRFKNCDMVFTKLFYIK